MPGPAKPSNAIPQSLAQGRKTYARSQSIRAADPQHHDFISYYGGGTLRGLYHGLTGAPTGAYMIGRAVAHDVGQAGAGITNPAEVAQRLILGRTGKIAKAVGKQEYESYRHFGKGGDLSGPLLDASAIFTGGASGVARGTKALSAISDAAKAERAAQAAELIAKDTGVAMAKGGGGIKGIGYDKAAEMLRRSGKDVTPSQLKTHARIHKFGLEEGNMSVGKPAGQQGRFANHPPHEVLKDAKHPLYDFYASRYPDKISNVERARKAFMQKPQYSRPLLKGPRGDKKRTGISVPTSPNPLFRQVRKGVEQIRPERSASRELRKADVARRETQARMNAPRNLTIGKQNVTAEPAGALQTAVTAPMSALRIAMWLRPRYYVQNLMQTGQMLGTAPIQSAKSARLAANIYRTNRDLYHGVRSVTGEAQAGALAEGTKPSRVANAVANRVENLPRVGPRVATQLRQRGIQGAMGYAANIPESHLRAISVLNELARRNRASGSLSDLTPIKVEQAIHNVRSRGVIAPEHLALTRARENVGDFGRIYSKNQLKQVRPSEREFMQTGIPIFYPMFKALSRYGVRMASEHPALTAETVAVGKQGKKEQKRLLGPLPFWAQYLVPKDAGNPNAKRSPHEAVWNPANIYNLQPATDIGRQTAEVFRKGGPNPGISYLQEAGPAPNIAYGLFTGHDLQTGYPIKPFSKAFYKAHPGMNRAPINTLYNYAQGLPLSDLQRLVTGGNPHLRSFVPGSVAQRLALELGPGPAFIPRTLRTKETTKQAKREERYGMGRAPRKKREYNP